MFPHTAHVESVALFDRMTELMVDRGEAYDLLVFDTTPTGHTLRLLQSPELLVTWVAALTKARRAMLPPDAEEPDPVLAALERRRDRLEEVRALMMRGRTTAFVLVIIAERLPIEEAARDSNEPGKFVALLGYEWTNWLQGHRHVLFFESAASILSSLDPRYENPDLLWKALEGRSVLTIAHHSAGGPVSTNWDFVPPEELEPVTERT